MVKSDGAVALVFGFSLFLGACASSGSVEPVQGPLVLPRVTQRGVQTDDQVVIAFYTAAGVEVTEVSGERTVDPNGEIFLPFLGTVPVSGLETAGIRRLLVDRYSALYSDPVVEVVTHVNVNITGAVRDAGQFFLPPSATLVDALARAGGVTSEVEFSGGASDPSKVRLVRDGVGTVIDMRPLEARPQVLDLRVQSGDWLYVPKAAPLPSERAGCFLGEHNQHTLHRGISCHPDPEPKPLVRRAGPSRPLGRT